MAIKTISQFPGGIPADNDYILFEQNGEGKSATIGDAVNTCSLTYEEIAASTDLDLINKIASAGALKHLKPVIGHKYLNNVTVGTSLSYISGAAVTIPAHCIFGISAALVWGNAPPAFVMLSNSNSGGPLDSFASASRDSNFTPGSLTCTYSCYTDDETTYYVWGRSSTDSKNAASIDYWYIQF